MLGDLFKSNWKSSIINEVATYQYFASSNGSMVYYPGEELGVQGEGLVG